jgi:probable rRNA maturation factor
MCAEIVRQEASDSYCPLNDHWAHLTIHGVLHLLGYDHETRQQADEMEALEIRLLDSLNIRNPYEALNV